MGAFYVSFLFSLSYLIAFGFMLEVHQALPKKNMASVQQYSLAFQKQLLVYELCNKLSAEFTLRGVFGT